MAKLTNTSATPIPLGSVVIQGHSTAEVPDDVLAEAKKVKVVEGWFANGTLKSDDEDAEEAEREKFEQQQQGRHTAGSPSGGVYSPPQHDDPNKK